MTTFYAIEVPSIYGNSSWVRTKEGNKYAGMGNVPTMFATEAQAKEIVRQYKVLSKNSGKPATPTKIVAIQF